MATHDELKQHSDAVAAWIDEANEEFFPSTKEERIPLKGNEAFIGGTVFAIGVAIIVWQTLVA